MSHTTRERIMRKIWKVKRREGVSLSAVFLLDLDEVSIVGEYLEVAIEAKDEREAIDLASKLFFQEQNRRRR